MSNPATLSAALAFVPSWWQETSDPAALDALLVGWVRATGCRAAGFVWPADAPAVVGKAVNGSQVADFAPPEVPDAARRTKAGESTVLYLLSGSAVRVYAPVMPAGRPLGLLWADKPAGQTWSEADRAYLVLTAKMMERSPAVATAIGPVIDPDRLSARLGDAAVIAGRMAHDFDNILTGIIGFADLTTPLIAPGSPAVGFVAEIAKVGQRGISFTQQLHQLSRSGQVKPNPGVVAPAVAKEEARLKLQAHPNLRIEKELPLSLPAVAIEAGPLQTLLGHLLENAVEACPQGGLIRVSARPVELTEADARTFLGRVGVGVHLLVSVSDTGTGIKPEVRRRLFAEPFYTTKVRHRGLGLAVAYRTLCAHRGGIQLDPVPPPGTGTNVRVVLPLATGRAPAITPPPPGVRDDSRNLGDAPPTRSGIRGPGENPNAIIVGG
ncbi:MAG TPA: HAMP domain-containing sensor histidine kinase [Gemmataceae bacterium]|nr:HAMP domain-containing sensor histidine kinase [Gemmataceae bacterium]